MDRLEAMQIFVATVDAGSFSGASRKLGIPLPTVSRKVSELEDHLKSRLLVRTTRKLSLTDAGAAYLATSLPPRPWRPASTRRRAASSSNGADHLRALPRARHRQRLPQAVPRDQRPDVAIRPRGQSVGGRHRYGGAHRRPADSSVIATHVGTVRRVVVGSPEYFVKHGMPKQLSDLVDLTCVTFAALNGNSSWVFPGKGRSPSLPVRPTCRLNINTAESAIDAAIADIGVTHVISHQVARPVAEGKLRVVLQEFEPEPMPVHLIHAAQGRLPLKMRSFLEFAAPRLRKPLKVDEVKLVMKPPKPVASRSHRASAKEKSKRETAAA